MSTSTDGVAFYPETTEASATANQRETLVYNNFNQRAFLSADYAPNSQPQDEVFHFQLFGKNSTKWSFTYEQCQVIYAQRQVKVVGHSKYEPCGVFTIGEKTNWLYSKSLFPSPDLLEQEILDLLAFALRG